MTNDPAAVPATVVSAGALQPADPSPGMTRRLAFETARTWSGTVVTEPGVASGWHHHGDHDTTLYVAAGQVRMESGPDGSVVMGAGAGDFLHIPPYAVHREVNPGEEPSTMVIVRSGTGQPTTNVDGPAPG